MRRGELAMNKRALKSDLSAFQHLLLAPPTAIPGKPIFSKYSVLTLVI